MDYLKDSIYSTLFRTRQKLENVPDTARLDAEILLAHILQKPRVYLYSHPESELSTEQQAKFEQLIQKRLQHYPVAYLIGQQEFYGLTFTVNQHVLIPRPETELIVDKVLELFSKNECVTVADLGTGSGAIAIAIAHNRPNWKIIATDISDDALKIAKQNARQHQCHNIQFFQGRWCDALPKLAFDAIVSNPPYIQSNDPHLSQGDVQYEPQQALISGEQGLDAIIEIAQQARCYLKSSGHLLIEHGYDQANAVKNILQNDGYENITVIYDLAGHARVTTCTVV